MRTYGLNGLFLAGGGETSLESQQCPWEGVYNYVPLGLQLRSGANQVSRCLPLHDHRLMETYKHAQQATFPAARKVTLHVGRGPSLCVTHKETYHQGITKFQHGMLFDILNYESYLTFCPQQLVYKIVILRLSLYETTRNFYTAKNFHPVYKVMAAISERDNVPPFQNCVPFKYSTILVFNPLGKISCFGWPLATFKGCKTKAVHRLLLLSQGIVSGKVLP